MNKFATKKRTEIGSNKVSKLRAEGYIPCIAYGHSSKTYEIAIPKVEFEKFLNYNEVGSKVQIKVGRSYEDAVLKEIQRDPVTRKVLHADFQILTAGETIKLKIPVHFTGKDTVEDNRTAVQEMIHELEIIALPKDLIDQITVDVTGKVLGDNISVQDLQALIPEGVEISDEADRVIVAIVGKVEFVEETDEEETETAEESSEVL
jgi:large subunit ribosomal protein L25